MGVLNTIGINDLGITVDTPSPEGGVIEKKDGEVTGYLEENAYINYIQSIPVVSNGCRCISRYISVFNTV